MKENVNDIIFKGSGWGRVYLLLSILSLLVMPLSIFLVKKINLWFFMFIVLQFALFLAFYGLYRIHSTGVRIAGDEIYFRNIKISLANLSRVDFKYVGRFLGPKLRGIVFYDKENKKISGVLESNFENEFDFMDFIRRIHVFSQKNNINFNLSNDVRPKEGSKEDSLLNVKAKLGDGNYLIAFIFQAALLSSFILFLPVLLGLTDKIILDIFLMMFIVGTFESPLVLYWYLFKAPKFFSLTGDKFCVRYRLRSECIPIKEVEGVSIRYMEIPVMSHGEVEISSKNKKHFRLTSKKFQKPYLIKEVIGKLEELSKKHNFKIKKLV